MLRPLYACPSPTFNPLNSHTGLWYDKFCDRWKNDWLLPSEQKVAWIRTVAIEQALGDAALISQYAVRQKQLVERLGGTCLLFQTESRFVTGLGREHPVENGFAWHPTLATPYLPGSGIKGFIRAWGTEWGSASEELLAEVLGSKAEGESHMEQAGSVIFFDAIPLHPVKLEIDVMTPHYNEYYQEGKPPGDWISPTPIPFLVVAEGVPFQFSFAPRTNAGKGHMEIIEAWLREALRWLGAGAKAAIGYGRFGTGKLKLNSSMSTPTATHRPRYKAGDVISVTRAKDPKPKAGKQRAWFIADDGFGGVVTSGTSPDIEIGGSTQLEIAAVMQHGGYNFRLPKRSSG